MHARPKPAPVSPRPSRASPRRVLSGVKELVSFLLAGVGAIFRFWAPAREAPAVDEEPASEATAPEPDDKKAKPISRHALATKATPYPAQEG